MTAAILAFLLLVQLPMQLQVPCHWFDVGWEGPWKNEAAVRFHMSKSLFIFGYVYSLTSLFIHIYTC